MSCTKGADLSQERTNLALGQKVEFSPPPNYPITQKGDTDAIDLTDGKLSARPDQQIWREQNAVGWSYAGRVNLAVDLGKQCSIDEIAIRFLGGTAAAGKGFPGWVEAFVSDDGDHYNKVAEFSRWHADDFKKFGVPAEAGKAWVYKLRFQNLKTQGRFVGLRFYSNGGGGTVSDELYVYGSSAANSAKPAGQPSGFTVQYPQPHFHKPYLELATNVPLPVPIGCIIPTSESSSFSLDPIAGESKPFSLEMEFDLPPGIELRGGHLDSVNAVNFTHQALPGGGKRYTVNLKKSTLNTNVMGNKNFGLLYLQASGWKNDQRGEMHYRYSSGSWQSPDLTIPLHAVMVTPAPRLKKIMAGLGWWNATASVQWPDVLAAWRTIGLNTFAVMGQNMPAAPDDPAWKLVDQARQEGFFISNVDSPISRMAKDVGMVKNASKEQREIYHQFSDDTTSKGRHICPAYRGKYYQQEIQRFAGVMAKVKPNFSSQDIELWGSTGPLEECKRCLRCQADFKASGLSSWEEWQKQKGLEMWSDLINAARQSTQAAGGPAFVTGGYDFQPGRAYQHVWDTAQLFQHHVLDTSQVSTYTNLYPFHWAMIGDEVRHDKAALPQAQVMPWITPGDAGTFPGDAFQWTLLECYTNGASGIWFWSGRVWDGEDLIAYNRVIRAIAPVEDVIADGQLIGDTATVQSPGRLSGMKLGNRIVLLAADYENKSDGTLQLHLNLPAKSALYDLFTGKVLLDNLPAGENNIPLPLNGAPARLIEVRPMR